MLGQNLGRTARFGSRNGTTAAGPGEKPLLVARARATSTVREEAHAPRPAGRRIRVRIELGTVIPTFPAAGIQFRRTDFQLAKNADLVFRRSARRIKHDAVLFGQVPRPVEGWCEEVRSSPSSSSRPVRRNRLRRIAVRLASVHALAWWTWTSNWEL